MKKLNCAIVTASDNWFIDSVLSCNDFNFYSVNPAQIGIDLPEDVHGLSYCDAPDIIIVDASFYGWTIKRYPENVKAAYAKLRTITKYKAVIATEGTDWFHLARVPEAYTECDIILKAQGVFKDPDMYNYEVGSCSTNRDWIAKTKRLDKPYPKEVIDKLRLSLPCFITINANIRHRARLTKKHISSIQKNVRHLGDVWSEVEIDTLRKLIKPTKLVHFAGGLTHMQRFEMLKKLVKYKGEGTLRINGWEEFLWGTEYGREPLPQHVLDGILKEIEQAGFLVKVRMNRNAFKRNLLKHKIILAPTGFGELTYRHAEGWQSGRAVLCQDLSHVNIMYPVENRKNVLFCKSDLSDITDRIEELRHDDKLCASISEEGNKRWKKWIKRPDELLRVAITDHIHKLLNI